MKVIIAGSRPPKDLSPDERFKWSSRAHAALTRAVQESKFTIREVVSGTADGVDRIGELWAKIHEIPVRRFPAQWNTWGKSAGYLRNCEMADNADALIAIWDGKSRGTQNMIDIARRKGLRVHVQAL